LQNAAMLMVVLLGEKPVHGCNVGSNLANNEAKCQHSAADDNLSSTYNTIFLGKKLCNEY
jgi:hypothetical protein